YLAELVKALAHAALDDVFQVDHAKHPWQRIAHTLGDDQRRTTSPGDALDTWLEISGYRADSFTDPRDDSVAGGLANLPHLPRAIGREIHAAHACGGAEGDQ